ncbi:MAG TPA: aspartyl protease family protein, partial [Verrucomicrobiae bacterium]
MSMATKPRVTGRPSFAAILAWPVALLLPLIAAPLPAADPPLLDPGVADQKPIVIPFEFSRGHIMLPARVNDSGPLSFMLDTGYALTMIHPAHAETLALKRVGHVTIVGIAGEEAADMLSGASFDLAGATYAPSRVASLPSEAARRGRRRDGILGNGFFKRFIVEVDPRAKTITLHEPKDFQYTGAGEVVPLTFRKSTPIVEASVNTPDGQTVLARFEIDTGCTGGLCLGRDFVQANHLDPDDGAARGGVRTGVGGSARTHDG